MLGVWLSNLEVDDDQEDDDGGHQVDAVGQVLAVEGLLQCTHLHSTRSTSALKVILTELRAVL